MALTHTLCSLYNQWHTLLSDLLCQVASSVGGTEDFVIKDGKVERQAQPDGMCGLHFGLGNVECFLV